MIQHFSISINKFFNSKSINFLDPISAYEFQLLESYYMNQLNSAPFHSHEETVCKSPNLKYVLSYTRHYITFKNGVVTEETITVPVFHCDNCSFYHALLPIHFIVPYSQFSLSFILSVLLDKKFSTLTVEKILSKYDISKTTMYRWIKKFSFYLRYYQHLRNKYRTSIFVSLLYCFEELITDFFVSIGTTLFQTNRTLNKPPSYNKAS